jgi:predicted PurR-regulated permease PerM
MTTPAKPREVVIFFIGTFTLLSALLLYMLSPYIYPILFGAILAGACWPVLLWLRQKQVFKQDQKRALLTMFFALVIIILPTILIAIQIYHELVALIRDITEFIAAGKLEQLALSDHYLAVKIREAAEKLKIPVDAIAIKEKISLLVRNYAGASINYFNSIVGNLIHFTFDFVLAIFASYAFLAYGPELKSYLFSLSPLPESEEELILLRFNQMNYVSLVCNGLGGLIQGGLAGLLFYFWGLPSVFLWTVIMVFLAFIPVLGISIITVPASIYLYFLKDSFASAFTFFVLTSIIALVVENWFKPKFIGNRIEAHPLFILICIIGGLQAFGLPGVFFGPIVGILFLTTASIYRDKYSVIP